MAAMEVAVDTAESGMATEPDATPTMPRRSILVFRVQKFYARNG
jgi:hypothetical protein